MKGRPQAVVWIPSLEAGLVERWEQKLKALDIEQEAIDDGHQNLPQSDASQISPTEERVVNIFVQARDYLLAGVRTHILKACQIIRGKYFGEFFSAPFVTQCKAEVEIALGEYRNPILDAAREQDRREADLNTFLATPQHDKKLRRRGPQTPIKEAVLAWSGVLVCLALFETALNLGFFFKHNGIIAGGTYAAAVSATNIALGLIGGFVGLRLMNHGFVLPALAGWVTFTGSFVSAVYANLLYAHAREINQTANGGFDLTGAARELSEAPFAIGGSVPVLLVGMLVYVIALLEGRAGFSDPYWGYAKLDRYNKDAQQQVTAVEEAMLQGAKRAVEKNLNQLEKIDAQAEAAAEDAQTAVDQARDRSEEVNDTQVRLVGLCRHSLHIYREKNREVRRARAPAYFGDENIPPLPHGSLDIERLLNLEVDTQTRLSQVRKEVAAARAEIALHIQAELQSRVQYAIEEARREAHTLNNPHKAPAQQVSSSPATK